MELHANYTIDYLTDFIGERSFGKDGRVEGFTHTFSTQSDGPVDKAPIESPNISSQKIKAAAKLFGAGSVGITEVDSRWVYSNRFNRKGLSNPKFDLPENLKYVIVLILPMDYELGKTFPSALSGSTTGKGYADSLQCATMLAQFITNLGFEAMASMNDTALNIPLAIQAGLGEYGRHGLLITPQYGPNVRIAKVFTDLPLSADKPVEFGVEAFCNICRKCSNACPPRAIPDGEPQDTPPNFSSFQHIKKWTVNAEKCFKFWVGMNTDCAICIRVCPYNKDYSKWWNKMGIKLASGPLRKFMLWLDTRLNFGKRLSPAAWWKIKTKSS